MEFLCSIYPLNAFYNYYKYNNGRIKNFRYINISIDREEGGRMEEGLVVNP